MKNKIKKALKCALAIALGVLLTMLPFALAVNAGMILKTASRISSPSDFEYEQKYDAVVVFGAGIRNGKPSPMLEDRLNTAIDIYMSGASDKILLSGDRQEDGYDEVSAMLEYTLSMGVPADDILTDFYGFSTYDTVSRAKDAFGIESAVLVTQKYHLYRALSVSDSLGIKTVGVDATKRHYAKELKYFAREMLARVKEAYFCAFAL